MYIKLKCLNLIKKYSACNGFIRPALELRQSDKPISVLGGICTANHFKSGVQVKEKSLLKIVIYVKYTWHPVILFWRSLFTSYLFTCMLFTCILFTSSLFTSSLFTSSLFTSSLFTSSLFSSSWLTSSLFSSWLTSSLFTCSLLTSSYLKIVY